MIALTCGCGMRFGAPEESTGLKGRCPRCGRTFRVPRNRGGEAPQSLGPSRRLGWTLAALAIAGVGVAGVLLASAHRKHAAEIDRQKKILAGAERVLETAEDCRRDARPEDSKSLCTKAKSDLDNVTDPELAAGRSRVDRKIGDLLSLISRTRAEEARRAEQARQAEASAAAQAAQEAEKARLAREAEAATARARDAELARKYEEDQKREAERARIAAEKERRQDEERAAVKGLFLAYTQPARHWARAVENGDTDQMIEAAGWYQESLGGLQVPDALRRHLATGQRVARAMAAAPPRIREALPRFEGDLPLKGDSAVCKVRVCQVAEDRIAFRYSFSPDTGPFYKSLKQLDVLRFLEIQKFQETALLLRIKGMGEFPGADGIVTPDGKLALFERDGRVYGTQELEAEGLVGRGGHAFTRAEEETRRQQELAAAEEVRQREERIAQAKEKEAERREAAAQRAQDRAVARARAEEERRARELDRDRGGSRGGGTSSGRGFGVGTIYRCSKCGYSSSLPGTCPRCVTIVYRCTRCSYTQSSPGFCPICR